MDRTERHREMAEAGIRAHQGLTAAHVAGRTPEVAAPEGPGTPTVFSTPQLGEKARPEGMSFGATETALRELQLYWKRIPDFGVIEAKVFASDTGWAQVLYWGGTSDDGQEFRAQEVDVITTDDDFAVTRYEIYSDAKQWRDIVKFVHGGQLPDVDYGALLAREPGSS